MSIYLRAALAVLLGVVLLGATWKLFHMGLVAGRAEVQVKWDAEKADAMQAAQAQQQSITHTVTKFVQRAAQERVVTRDIIKEVEVYVPKDLTALPADFRVFHDAAAEGRALPAADDPARANAAPVLPKVVAATVATNYADCRYDQQRLEALQEILKTLDGKDDGDQKEAAR